MSLITQRLATIRQQLPPQVRLIAVTKQVSVDAMREAYAAGVRDFGESKVQEAEAKVAQLADLSDLNWHFIGHLQTNKVKKALEIFNWIHTCDSLKLAQRLNRLAIELSQQPKVCLQVKLMSDPNKFGWMGDELLGDLPELAQCDALNFQGLMTILPVGLSESQSQALFSSCRELAQKIRSQNYTHLQQISELSMGMSGDYHLAVQAGATMIRLGTVIFGERTAQSMG